METTDTIRLLLKGILIELKARQYMNNVSVSDIEEVFGSYIDAFNVVSSSRKAGK